MNQNMSLLFENGGEGDFYQKYRVSRPKGFDSCYRDVIISQICQTLHVGSLCPTVVYIRINNVYIVLAMLRLASHISHYSPVTFLFITHSLHTCLGMGKYDG